MRFRRSGAGSWPNRRLKALDHNGIASGGVFSVRSSFMAEIDDGVGTFHGGDGLDAFQSLLWSPKSVGIDGLELPD